MDPHDHSGLLRVPGTPRETLAEQEAQHDRADMERQVEHAAGDWAAALHELDGASQRMRLHGRDVCSNREDRTARSRAARVAPALLAARLAEHRANVAYQEAQRAFVSKYGEEHSG